jgi:hypothetical protein
MSHCDLSSTAGIRRARGLDDHGVLKDGILTTASVQLVAATLAQDGARIVQPLLGQTVSYRRTDLLVTRFEGHAWTLLSGTRGVLTWPDAEDLHRRLDAPVLACSVNDHDAATTFQRFDRHDPTGLRCWREDQDGDPWAELDGRLRACDAWWPTWLDCFALSAHHDGGEQQAERLMGFQWGDPEPIALQPTWDGVVVPIEAAALVQPPPPPS